MKATFHKSCGCRMCRLGRGRPYGQFIRKANERKFRHQAKVELRTKGENAVIAPISSPYTD